jgi:DNA processing protein
LIKQGAKLVESVEDVMEALGYIGEQLQEHVTAAAAKASENIETPLFDVSQLKLSEDEKTIYDCLGKEPLHVDQIIEETDLAAGSINAALVSLRLKGLIKQLPGSLFLRR